MTRPAAKAPTRACHAHLSQIGIDFYLGEHGAVGMHGVIVARPGRPRACRALRSAQPGAGQDLRIAFAAALIVAAQQTAAARDHAGIAGAEQRRGSSLVARSASPAMASAPALSIAMPAVAVCAEPPAMPASGKSEVPLRNST